MTDGQTTNILTEATLPAYLVKNKSFISVLPDAIEESNITAKVITGGNVNYAFQVTGPSGLTVFVKQAPEFVAIFGPDGYPLTSERMKKEMDVYQEWKNILAASGDDKVFLPEIYFFDRMNMVVVMQFFEGFHLYDDVLVKEGIVIPSIASGLGKFIGKTHAATHSSVVNVERNEFMTKEFENRAMRDVQLEFVFTKCYKEATDEQRAGLVLDDKFMAEVESLKNAYDGKGADLEGSCGHVLSHGDLHPGSVMVDQEKGLVKIIDPEFCVYGPPGLDVGSLLSGFVLAAVHHAHNDDSKINSAEAVSSINNGVSTVWESYKAAMLENDNITPELVDRVAAESVGFTVAEVCRTALGFAGGRLWLQFDDPEVKASSIKTAMGLVQTCMTGRHNGGMEVLLKELDKLVSK